MTVRVRGGDQQQHNTMTNLPCAGSEHISLDLHLGRTLHHDARFDFQCPKILDRFSHR
jgi:hypothetical protein